MGATSLAIIPFTLVRKKGAKGVTIAVKRDGSCCVTASPRVAMKDIHALVESRAKWIMGAREKMQLVPPSVMDVGTAVDYAKYKYVALKLVLDRIAFWNAQLGLFYRAVTIRDMRSRWGSCSRDGRLAFTYRLALLPQELVDYVVVHELCHLIVFDHSPAFWKKVESCLPNYRQLKLLLKRS